MATFPTSVVPTEIQCNSGVMHSVYSTGIAVNLDNTGASVPYHSVLAFPVRGPTTPGCCGVVQLVNKRTGGFDLADETMLHCCTQLLSQWIAICPQDSFFSGFDPAGHNLTEVSQGEPMPAVLPNGTVLPVDKAQPHQLVFRTVSRDPAGYISATEAAASKQLVATESGSLHEVYSYVDSMEKMWRSCLDTNAALNREAERLKSRLSASTQEVGQMEAAVKALGNQFTRIRTDVSLLKAHVTGQQPDPVALPTWLTEEPAQSPKRGPPRLSLSLIHI